MGQQIIDAIPYEDRARVALALFWSAACSEDRNVSTASAGVHAFLREGGKIDASMSGALAPYLAAQSNMFTAFGEWLTVWHLNRPGGPNYYGDMAEVAAEMCEVASEIGYEPDTEAIYRLRAAACDRIEWRKPCKHVEVQGYPTNGGDRFLECVRCGWTFENEDVLIEARGQVRVGVDR